MTDKAKHTPGPWRIRELIDDTLAIYGPGDMVLLCRMTKANARLISAAPLGAELAELVLSLDARRAEFWDGFAKVVALAREFKAKVEGL